jgi:hypothetical protein
MKPMDCRHCGAIFPPGVRKCPECGWARETREERHRHDEWQAYQERQRPKFAAIYAAIDAVVRAELGRLVVIGDAAAADPSITSQARVLAGLLDWPKQQLELTLCQVIQRIDGIEAELKRARPGEIAPQRPALSGDEHD